MSDIMKNTILFLVLALLLFNCTNVEMSPVESGNSTIQAVMEADDTKTSVTDEGVFTWSEGDKIWMHTTNGSVEDYC